MIQNTESMEILPETQTQIVDCTQASKFDVGTPESPTKDVADLELQLRFKNSSKCG